jgi:hypothetical protein
VLSHDEEMRSECSLLYTTRLAGASWVLRTVCSPVLKSILKPTLEWIILQYRPWVFVPLHLPIHASREGLIIARAKAGI